MEGFSLQESRFITPLGSKYQFENLLIFFCQIKVKCKFGNSVRKFQCGPDAKAYAYAYTNKERQPSVSHGQQR